MKEKDANMYTYFQQQKNILKTKNKTQQIKNKYYL